jgi:imidazolonepropionase-like amidohydrolase
LNVVSLALICGGVSNAVGPLGMSFNVDGTDEVMRAVRQNLFSGAIQIKTYVSGGVTSEISPLAATPFTKAELDAMGSLRKALMPTF